MMCQGLSGETLDGAGSFTTPPTDGTTGVNAKPGCRLDSGKDISRDQIYSVTALPYFGNHR
jgi:hypothetical protein